MGRTSHVPIEDRGRDIRTHTEGMYLTVPHLETYFRICKVMFQII